MEGLLIGERRFNQPTDPPSRPGPQVSLDPPAPESWPQAGRSVKGPLTSPPDSTLPPLTSDACPGIGIGSQRGQRRIGRAGQRPLHAAARLRPTLRCWWIKAHLRPWPRWWVSRLIEASFANQEALHVCNKLPGEAMPTRRTSLLFG